MGPRRFLAATLAFTLAALALLRLAERALLFPAPPAAPQVTLPDGGRRAALASPAGDVEAFLLPATAGAPSGPLLVYAHGNGELVDPWLREFAELRALGLSVLLVEYPGYGRSGGSPSETSIQRALIAGYDWAAAQPEVDRARVIGWGRSLGGGAICALGRARPLAALILESTFTSAADVAAERFGVPRFLVGNRFDNASFVREYASPLLLLHGERDDSIPMAHARRLAALAPAAELQIVACGHNDCPRAWSRVERFLRARRILPGPQD